MHKSSDSLYEGGANGSAFVELTNFSQAPPPSRLSYHAAMTDSHPHEVLQLNEDSNTWKLTPKKLRKKMATPLHSRTPPHAHHHRAGHSPGGLLSSVWRLKEFIRHENVSEFRFRMIVAFLFLTIVLCMGLSQFFQAQLEIDKAIHNQISIERGRRRIAFLDRAGKDLLKVHFGLNIPKDVPPVSCRSIEKGSKFCLDWQYRAKLALRHRQTPFVNSFGFEDAVTCYVMRWDSYEKHSELKDCFDMAGANW